MTGSTRAVIDVGTNSVKLLVADVFEREAVPLLEKGTQTRLGHGLYQTGRLSQEAIELTAETVHDFQIQSEPYGCDAVQIVATSAAREASNTVELQNAIRAATGLEMQIISGDDEARFAFIGATSHLKATDSKVVIADVGGGSSELMIGEAGKLMAHSSFQLGTVRLYESNPPSDPPTVEELRNVRVFLDTFIAEKVLPAIGESLQSSTNDLTLIGTGGTSSILARITGRLAKFERDQIDNTRFTLAQLTQLTEQLWHLPLADRKQLKGLPSERADVILTGTVIYEALLRNLPIKAMTCSTRGLRFGILLAGG